MRRRPRVRVRAPCLKRRAGRKPLLRFRHSRHPRRSDARSARESMGRTPFRLSGQARGANQGAHRNGVVFRSTGKGRREHRRSRWSRLAPLLIQQQYIRRSRFTGPTAVRSDHRSYTCGSRLTPLLQQPGCAKRRSRLASPRDSFGHRSYNCNVARINATRGRGASRDA